MAKGSRLRIALGGGAAIVALVALLVVATREPARYRPPTTEVGSGSGNAATSAPPVPWLPAVDDPSGVRLTGFVIDGAGSPVVGVEVTAELEAGAVDPALAPAPNGDAAALPGHVFTGAPTAPDGRFALGGLTPGRYRLRVTGAGLLPAEVRYVPAPSDATRIVVARQVTIAGVVLDEGKPAVNVMVGLRGDAIGGTIERKSGIDGAFTFADLPEGRYQLYAYRGSLSARAVRVNRIGTGPFIPLELRLEPAAIVIGRIVDRDEGTPIIGAIELRPSGDDQAPRYARSGVDGVFRIEGVPNGRWIADAYAPGYLSPGGVELEAGKGVPELALARGATVSGRVLDASGQPVLGATVRAVTTIGSGPTTEDSETSDLVEQDKLRRYSGMVIAQAPRTGVATSGDPQFLARGELGVMLGPIPPLPPPGAASTRSATIDPAVATLAPEPSPLPSDPVRSSIWTTGADGVYRIRGLGRGKVRVLAVAAGFAEGRSKQVNVDGAQVVSNVDIVLSPGTFVIGTVSDQRGAKIAGAQITATPEGGAALDAFSDADGTYRLGPIAGKVELVATAYGHGDARRTVELAPPTSRTAAEQTEDFVLLVADAVLAGVIDDANGTPVGGAQIEVLGGAGEGRRAVTRSDGGFEIQQLPAGPVRIHVVHPDYPSAELTATATTGGNTHARLTLPLGGRAEGAVVEASSGAPLGGIVLSGTGPGGATADTTTDEAGRWRLGPLAPGTWKLTIKLPGFLPLARSIDVPLARTPGATSVRDIRLELARGALIGGTIRDSRGQRIAGAAITIRPFDGDGPTAEGIADANGEFRIRDAPTGDLLVSGSKDAMGGSIRVTVRGGDEILGLALDIK